MRRPLILASRSPQRQRDPRASSGSPSSSRPGRRRGAAATGDAARSRARERAAQGACGRAAGRPGRDVLGVDTEVLPRRAPVRQGRRRAAGPRPSAAPFGPHARGLQRRGAARWRAASGPASRAPTVTFRELDAELVDWYLASGEWRERAGAYAVQGQGAALVASIDGDYWNVVGLPVPLLLDMAPVAAAG